MYVIKSNRKTNSYTVRKINRVTQVVRVGRRGLDGDAATVKVGATTTLQPGSNATVVNSGTTHEAVLDFGIPKGEKGDPATNLVQSVNGKQGAVVLNATDVGADPTGSSAQALQDAKDYTDSEVSTLDSSLATVAKTGSYNDLSNKPTIPSIAGLATETYVDTKVGVVASDLLDHEADKNNPHEVTKAQVGLGNVSNLAPADMPVSTAQQTALNAKANASDTVNLTGNQTIAGVKTFSSSPVVPTATTNTQAVNKAQMDTADALKVNKTGDTMTGRLAVRDPVFMDNYVDLAYTGNSNYAVAKIGNLRPAADNTISTLASVARDSLGNSRDFGSISWRANNVDATSKNSVVSFSKMLNNNEHIALQLNSTNAILGYNELRFQLDGPRIISGTGFPNGVVSAPVGSTYTDTNATNGAIEWKKATGTGNTGWVVSVGSANKTIVQADLLNGWTLNGGRNVILSRNGNIVTLTIIRYTLIGTAATANSILTIPSGYRASVVGGTHTLGEVWIGSASQPNSTPVLQGVGAALDCRVRDEISGTVSWLTSDAWPTA